MADHPTSVKLDTDTLQRLRRISEEYNLGLGWLIAKAVERFLADYDKTGPIILVEKSK